MVQVRSWMDCLSDAVQSIKQLINCDGDNVSSRGVCWISIDVVFGNVRSFCIHTDNVNAILNSYFRSQGMARFDLLWQLYICIEEEIINIMLKSSIATENNVSVVKLDQVLFGVVFDLIYGWNGEKISSVLCKRRFADWALQWWKKEMDRKQFDCGILF